MQKGNLVSPRSLDLGRLLFSPSPPPPQKSDRMGWVWDREGGGKKAGLRTEGEREDGEDGAVFGRGGVIERREGAKRMGRYSHLWTAEKGQGHLSVKAKREERDIERQTKTGKKHFFLPTRKGQDEGPLQ